MIRVRDDSGVSRQIIIGWCKANGIDAMRIPRESCYVDLEARRIFYEEYVGKGVISIPRSAPLIVDPPSIMLSDDR